MGPIQIIVEETQSVLAVYPRLISRWSTKLVVVIYCHLSKLSVGQTPRLYNLPSKSYSNNINVPHPGGNDLVKESGKPLNGMPIKF